MSRITFIKWATVVLLAGVVLGMAAASPGGAQSSRRAKRYASDRIIVKLREQPAAHESSQVGDDILQVRGTHAESLRVQESGGPHVIELSGVLSVEQAVERASRDPRVEYAEPDYYVYPAETTPNDPFFGQMWGLFNDGTGGKAGADIGALRAWDLTTGSQDVVVAVPDGGVDLTHPDLSANVWVNMGEIAGNGVDDDGNGFVDDLNGWNFFGNNNDTGPDPTLGFFFSHGTHIAGTIGAVGNNGLGVAGVLWSVRVMALKIFGRNSDGVVVGSTTDAVRSINYAVDQKRLGQNVRVINASWAGPENPRSLRDAIAEAGEAGILFVCAAGNGGSDRRGDDMDNPEFALYPAAWNDLSSLVSVTALDRADNLASFSNFGHTTVTIGAPGLDIISTFPNGQYSTSSGTSMATPHAAGIAALLFAYSPGLGPAEVRQRLISTAVPVLGLASKAVSSGRANAYNALTDTRAPAGEPALSAAEATKKLLTLDGIGFVLDAIVVEVNGVAIPRATRYDEAYKLGNGAYTRIQVKLGKPLMREMIPIGVPVTLTVLNQNTGVRSAPLTFTRN